MKMLSNQAEIERLQQQIARLRNQIPENEVTVRAKREELEHFDQQALKKMF